MDTQIATSLAGIVVAGVAAASAYASQKAAAKASVVVSGGNNRTEMEQGAYERARAFDTETIRRQDEELAELRAACDSLRAQVRELNDRIARQESTRVENNTDRRNIDRSNS